MGVYATLKSLIDIPSNAKFYTGFKKLEQAEPIFLSLAKEDEFSVAERIELANAYIRRLNESQWRSSVSKERISQWLAGFLQLKNELLFRLKEEHTELIKREIILPYIAMQIENEAQESLDQFLLRKVSSVMQEILDTPFYEDQALEKQVIQAKSNHDEIFPLMKAFEGLNISSLGADSERASAGIRYIKSIIQEFADRSRTYQVRGLFVINRRGEIRDIRVTFHSGPQEEDYGLRIEDSPDGKRFRDSVKNSIKAASSLIKKNIPSFRIGFDAPYTDEYAGGSIGLAVAAAIIADATDQEVGIERAGDIAITGEVLSENGDIGPVGGVDLKAKAIKLWNERLSTSPISHILVPEENRSDVPRELGLVVHTISNVADLFQMLFDPWQEYLRKWEPFTDSDTFVELLNPENSQNAVLKPYYQNSQTITEGIAKEIARARSGVKSAKERLQEQKYRIPVVLDVKGFRKDTLLLDMAAQSINKKLGNSGEIGKALIEKELRAGRFSLIMEGLDSPQDSLDFFSPGAALHADIESCYYTNQLVFVCNEGPWRRYSQHIKDSGQFRQLKLYKQRSTVFDNHIEHIIHEGASKLILACRSGDIKPMDFFYGTEGKGYLELMAQMLNQDGVRYGEIRNLTEIIKAGKEKHILLVGEGGAGKTTTLLKLIFDYNNGQLVGHDGTHIVPVFLHANDIIEDNRILGLNCKVQSPEVDSELRHNKNILIMIDGLNEVKTDAEEDFLSAIKHIVNEYPEQWIILTSRKQEYARSEPIIAKDIIQDNFTQFELLNLDLSIAEGYLSGTINPELVEQIISELGTGIDILANPMIVYLMSTIPDEIEKRMQSGESLSRGWIYQTSVNQWLVREINSRKSRLGIDAIQGILKLFAYKMVESHKTSLTKEDAISFISELYSRRPRPYWYPKDKKTKAHLHPTEVFDELVSCPLLRVSL